MADEYPEVTNLQYVSRENIAVVKRIFLSGVNSFHGSALARKILSQNSKAELFETAENDEARSESVIYEVCGTWNEKDDEEIPAGVTILNPAEDSFHASIEACDVIILDISKDFAQLSAARKFLKHFEQQLSEAKIDKLKHVVLLSTIMTWAMTPQQEDVLTDASYRSRRPHPCFLNHMLLETDVINLSKKYKELVSSVVVCPGIIYGGRQDILHFLYKKSYFNHHQVEIFAPATNFLPLIYIEDFARIVTLIIQKFPGSSFPYILAVQPENLTAHKIIGSFIEAAGGPETRLKICSHDEVFLMSEELMTVSFKFFRKQLFTFSNFPAKSLQSLDTQPQSRVGISLQLCLCHDRIRSRCECRETRR